MINCSDNGQENFWVNGETYLSYNTGLTVKEESYWVNGDTVMFLQADPTSFDFLGFFF
jgi:hypothetical protein